MASSKAFKRFQHLETECPSFPQKLQVSLDFFLALEVDSPDFEESLPFQGFARRGGGGLGSYFDMSFFALPFFFDFPLEFWATNAWVEVPVASTC